MRERISLNRKTCIWAAIFILPPFLIDGFAVGAFLVDFEHVRTKAFAAFYDEKDHVLITYIIGGIAMAAFTYFYYKVWNRFFGTNLSLRDWWHDSTKFGNGGSHRSHPNKKNKMGKVKDIDNIKMPDKDAV